MYHSVVIARNGGAKLKATGLIALLMTSLFCVPLCVAMAKIIVVTCLMKQTARYEINTTMVRVGKGKAK